LGWAYALAPGRPRFPVSLALTLAYAALFGLVGLVTSQINLLAHYEILLPLWQHGYMLHWLTALMLLLWGLVLLRRGPEPHCGSASRGWLALVIPCPVCLSVVLMSAAALNLYFPSSTPIALAGLFLAFMGIAYLAAFLARAGSRQSEGLEASLGLTMLLVALYFILSALLLPQFSEVGRVYRLAAYALDGRAVDSRHQFWTLGAVLVLLALGFCYRNLRRIR
jgi:predicted transporter